MIYTTRPKDGSQKAWDYVTKTYGEINKLEFVSNCCGPQNWFASLKSGTRICVDSNEVTGKRNNI